MKQTGRFIIIVTALAIAGVFAFLVWSFIEGRKEMLLEQESEQPIKVPSRVSIDHGESVITIDVATQKLSGITTTVLAPAPVGGPGPSHAIMVPDSAVVWLGGRAWIYVEKDAERFVRRPVPVDHRVREGFVTDQFAAGDRVVAQGAQLLLSEELKSQIQIGD